MSNQVTGNRVVVNSKIIDGLLKQQGVRVPQRRACCGGGAKITSYAPYLKRLGYTGRVAIKNGGVITELVDL